MIGKIAVSNSLRNVVLAELGKLRTLPATAATIAVTVLGTTGLAIAFAAATLGRAGDLTSRFEASSALGTGLHVIRYGQIGLILLGILTAAGEYSGGQIRTTLAGVPGRALLLTGKTIAYSVYAVPTASLTVAASSVAAQATLGGHGVPVSDFFAAENLGPPLGAAAYLVLIGLLAYAVAVLVRDLVGALVMMLTLVLAVSPLLTAMTPAAAYLPDQAGARLYQTTPVVPEVLTAAQGAAVMGAWIVLALSAAAVAFTKRDA